MLICVDLLLLTLELALGSPRAQPASKQVLCVEIQKKIIYWHLLCFWHARVGKGSASELREKQSCSCLQDILHFNLQGHHTQPSHVTVSKIHL